MSFELAMFMIFKIKLTVPGRRTAHSRFRIPLNPHEKFKFQYIKRHTSCGIDDSLQGHHLGEAPMMHKHCFETVDKTLKDIMEDIHQANKHKPFGGKTVVFGGDFRQILSVVTKGSRQDIVNATINASTIWKHCTVLRLSQNMRLQSVGDMEEHAALKDFSEWIASIGDGKVGPPNDGCVPIETPDDLLFRYSGELIAAIVDETYSIFRDTIDDPMFLKNRAILALTLNVVNSINYYMNDLNTSEGYTYLSSDSSCKSDQGNDFMSDLHIPKFLDSIKCFGIPNHELHMNVGTPVMLLRNIDYSMGLYNSTRLVVTRLATQILQFKILTGAKAGRRYCFPYELNPLRR